MSEFKLRPAQQLFVDSFDKNTLVSASAGSGKTSTMISKLTKMIVENRIPLKKLLVVTYTNSAGSEMKQKLFNSLSKELSKQEDESVISFISEQIDEMSNCDIGTLHGICKKIITGYFYVVEQDPSFTLLDGQQADYLFDNAMNSVFNKLIVEDNEEFYSIYRLYNKKRNLNTLKYIIKTINNYLLSKVDIESWKNYVLNTCCSSDNNISKKYLVEYYKSLFSAFIEDFKGLKAQCDNFFDKYSKFIGDRLNFVLAVADVDDYKQLYEFVNNYQFVTKPRISSGSLGADESEFNDKLELIIKEFTDLLKSFKTNFVMMSDDDFKAYRQLVESLFKLQEKVQDEYKKVKKHQNALDFSDLEHITLKILENPIATTALKEKYDYIFVDEYQDINQVQEEIISRIKRDNNLYMIGDVKQSIYAFRLSSPEIFINKFNTFSKDGVKNQVINLNENFRSNKNILEFSNLIFNKLITEKTIGINYEANSQLVCGKTDEFKKCVSLDLIKKESELTEGQLIAMKVGGLIAEGFNYRDIAILLRSKGELVNEISTELKKYNIPCETTYKTNLFKTNEVLVLYYILKLVNCTYDDLAMATTLKSIFIGLSDNELAEIRTINSDMSFSECAYEYMLNGRDSHIKLKLESLNNLLSTIRFKLNSETISDVMDYVVDEYDVYNHYLSFVDGLEKIGNVKEFLRLLKNEDYKYDLQKCINYLDTIKKDGEVTLTLSGVGNSVKIMTIHSSKGLEYPAVILGGISKKFVLNKQTEDVIINDTLGIGVKRFDVDRRVSSDSITKNACKLMNKKNEIDEEIRLLYVALTRAKNRLCIVGVNDIKDVYRLNNKGVYSSKSYLDLMIKAMPKNVLQFFNNEKDSFTLFSETPYEFDVKFVDDMEEEISLEKEIILNAGDKVVEDKIGKYFDYNYPHINNTNIALKNSVSQILKEEVDYEKQVDSIVSEAQLDDYSLRLGTAYHNIMQKLKYTEDLGDILTIIKETSTADLPYKDVDPVKVFKAVQELNKYISPDSKIMKETQFVMKTNYGELKQSEENIAVLIQGVIDLVIVNNDEAIIVDFKTNKTHNKQYLIDQYGLQLKMYALAFEKAHKIKVNKKMLYSFEMATFIDV